MNPTRLAKTAAKKLLGKLPPPASRLSGKLAKDGGTPVRDTRLRPWPQYPPPNPSGWKAIAPRLKQIFLRGPEGLPQPLATEFAKQWAAYCGTKHALLLPHGTDALRLAIAAALKLDGLDHGGEIIVPNLTFIASATAALDRRCGVALVDVDPATLNIDPRRVEQAILPGKTRAIMAVHLFGQPADMTALRAIAAKHSLLLIEDAAQAHGAIHELGKTGSLGAVAAFSMQSSKNLCSGEGGALTTDDTEIYERAHSMHNAGRAVLGAQRWRHESLGWNIRPTEYIAAVLLQRLKTLDAEQQTRHDRLMALRRYLEDVPCVEPLGIGPGVRRHGAHMFVMRYRAENCGGLSLEDFLNAINKEGIPVARAYAKTLAQQSVFQRLAETRPDYIRVLPTPVADEAVKQLIYIPHPVLLGSDADMREIAAAFQKLQKHYAPAATKRSQPKPQTPIAATAAPPKPARPIRVGIIGVGAMGRQHAEAITQNRQFSLVAVADAQPQAAREMAARYHTKCFASAEQLIGSGEVDAVVIATPHWLHPKLAVAGLEAGLHVICEKPLAVTVAQADEVIRVAARSKGRFAVVYQTRFQPVYRQAKQLIDSGELGAVYRCSMLESAWRTQAYYCSSPWRGSWKGEGGGVLLNQAPHILDRYVWLCGLPQTVSARCDTILHRIEVEDTVSAVLRHASGAHGFIHISTVEAPPVSQTVISCDRGRIVIEDGTMRVVRLRDSIREKTFSETRWMGELEHELREFNLPQLDVAQLLDAFYSDVAAAIQNSGALTCPGQQGVWAVELANAMTLSSARGETVSLPLDREQYSRFIAEKIGKPVGSAAEA